jgi:hypothetical protein
MSVDHANEKSARREVMTENPLVEELPYERNLALRRTSHEYK